MSEEGLQNNAEKFSNPKQKEPKKNSATEDDIMGQIPHPDEVFDMEAIKQKDAKAQSSFFAFNLVEERAWFVFSLGAALRFLGLRFLKPPAALLILTIQNLSLSPASSGGVSLSSLSRSRLSSAHTPARWRRRWSSRV